MIFKTPLVALLSAIVYISICTAQTADFSDLIQPDSSIGQGNSSVLISSPPAAEMPAESTDQNLPEPSAKSGISIFIKPDDSELTFKLNASINIDISSNPVLNLTIEEAIDKLLEYNPEINKARLEWRASQDKLIASIGAYEPAFVNNVKLESTQRPLALLNQVQNSYTSGIEGLLPSATKYNLNFSFNDIRYRFSDNSSTPSAFTGITLTQPILRGLWFGKPVQDFKTARVEKQIALHKFRSTLFNKIYELETAYWKLCYAQKKIDFAATSVNIAQEIVNDSRLQLKAGKISQMDTIEASAGLATRLANFTDAQKDLLSAINDLKLLIEGVDFLKDTLIYASTPFSIEVKDSLHDFYQKPYSELYLMQPDYLQKKRELEKEQLARDYQTDQCLPDLNIKGTCGYLVSGRFSDVTWNNFLDPDYRHRSGTYSAEIELRIPLGMNVKERNLLNAEKRSVQSAEINLQTVQIQINNYISASMKRISDLHRNLENAKIVVDFRKTLLEAEIVSQKAGKSNYRKIFDIEEELTKSRQWEIENMIEYKSMKTQLAKLRGTILVDKKLEVFVKGKPVLDPKITGETVKRRDLKSH